MPSLLSTELASLPRTRAEARAKGERYFFSGIPCRHGHVDKSFAFGGCAECNRVRARNHIKNLTPDELEAHRAARRIAYHARHKEKHLKWLSDNRQRCLESERRWNNANRDRVRLKNKNRRARKRGASGSYTPEDVIEIRKAQKGKCAVCRTSLRKCETIDHIVPIFVGGTNDKSNIQLLCHSCNSSKRAKDPIEFMQSRGYLL